MPPPPHWTRAVPDAGTVPCTSPGTAAAAVPPGMTPRASVAVAREQSIHRLIGRSFAFVHSSCCGGGIAPHSRRRIRSASVPHRATSSSARRHDTAGVQRPRKTRREAVGSRKRYARHRLFPRRTPTAGQRRPVLWLAAPRRGTAHSCGTAPDSHRTSPGTRTRSIQLCVRFGCACGAIQARRPFPAAPARTPLEICPASRVNSAFLGRFARFVGDLAREASHIWAER